MADLFAEGDNYSMQLNDNLLEVEVWARTDLSFERGAELAGEMADILVKASSDDALAGVVLNLHRAPYVWGPMTDVHIRRMIAGVTGNEAGFVFVSNDPLQAFQARDVVAEVSPSRGRVAESLSEARSWLRK